MAENDLVLLVDGYEHRGWTAVQVQRSIDALADSFDLQLATNLGDLAPVEILEDSPCEIRFRGELLLSGYVERVERSYTATSRTYTASGRSRAGDLVDCSAIHAPWSQTPLLQIAQELCDPFGLQVSNQLFEALPTEPRFVVEQGETVFAALDRLARAHGMRLASAPDGSVLFTKTGLLRYPDVVIEAGVNVEEGSLVRSMEERFSRYIFRAKLAASDENFGENTVAKYEVTDEGVSRHRPLVVDSDNQRGQAALERAAAWERNTRAGRSRPLQYSVVDPLDPGGSWLHARGIWEPNIIVAVRDSILGVEGEFLVTEVTLSRSVDQGTRTQVTLMYPEAYDVKAPKPKKRKKGMTW